MFYKLLFKEYLYYSPSVVWFWKKYIDKTLEPYSETLNIEQLVFIRN